MLIFATQDLVGCDGCDAELLNRQNNHRVRSFVSQALICLSHDNQTSSPGVTPNKSNKNVHTFHEYFEYITSAAHFDVITYCITYNNCIIANLHCIL
jgi:hypothetical protein